MSSVVLIIDTIAIVEGDLTRTQLIVLSFQPVLVSYLVIYMKRLRFDQF
jgi:hypothetical protein